MTIDVYELAIKELASIYEFTEHTLQLPGFDFEEFFTLSVEMLAWERTAKKVAEEGVPQFNTSNPELQLRYERLCNSSPYASRRGLTALSTIHMVLLGFIREIEEGERASTEEQISYLMALVTMKGTAFGRFNVYEDQDTQQDALMNQALQFMAQGGLALSREQLAANGRKGGKSRGERSQPLKDWALKQAACMPGKPADIARRLAKDAPHHLRHLVGDPERVIRDELYRQRAAKKQAL